MPHSGNPIIALVLCFWSSSAALAYTFVGYAMLMRLLGRRRHMHSPASDQEQPAVAVVMVVHNEASRLGQRLHNLLKQEYPSAKRQIIVVSDGSTDDLGSALPRSNAEDVMLVERSTRTGKASCLNAALATRAAQSADVIVFADARQSFEPRAIQRLIAHFADPTVGAVSGALEVKSATSNVGQAVDAYWNSEKALREAEGRYDSCIGCTGAVYAIRRVLFQPIPEDTLLDDVVIPMQIALRGYRVLFEPAAVAFDPQPLEPASEAIRKRRTLAGNFQMLFRYPKWLLPWRNRLWWQLLSHKYLRLVAPGFLLLTFLSSACLSGSPFYRLAFVAQCLLYLLGIVGMLRPSRRHPAVAIPAGFLFLNTITVRAFWHYLTNPDLHRWQKTS